MNEPANHAATQNVLVIDDHSTFAELLTDALNRQDGFASPGHADTGGLGVELYKRTRPEVVLMDIDLPDMSGFEATTRILRVNREAKIIILTAHVTASFVARAAESGACGFLAKDGHFLDMLRTIRSATLGSLTVAPELVVRVVARGDGTRTTPLRPLSDRELDVLRLMADGRDVTAIAHNLKISTNTCRGHIKSILSKLGAHSQLEAVITAVRSGLITIGEPVPGEHR